jgi:hypothetical protein
MNPSDVSQSFIELCQSSQPSIDGLAAGLRKGIEEVGFRYYALCSHVDPLDPPPHALMMHNYPAAWAQYFSEAKLYRSDPVLKRAERDPSPFFWDTAFRTGSSGFRVGKTVG